MLLATLVGAGLWLGVSVGVGLLLSPVPEYLTGTCYRGFDGADGRIEAAPAEVDCEVAHDSEVVGNIDLPGGAYPGEAALVGWGNVECPRLLEQYGGASPAIGGLSLTIRYPDSSLWGQGDRSVDCLVVAAEGEDLIGSVRGASS